MKFEIKIFSDRLKELRVDKGLTIVQLAEAIGVNNGTISKWENGQIMPQADSIFSLSKFFNVSAGYLIGTEN